MDWNYLQTEFEKIKLWEFTQNICGLSEVWFGNAESNELYDEMTEFIYSSGVYGARKYAVISAMNTNYKQRPIGIAKLLIWLRLFFPELNQMKILCPFLGSLPFLLPACWVIRGVKCLLFKRKHTLQMITNVHAISEEDATRLRNLHKKAGLGKH